MKKTIHLNIIFLFACLTALAQKSVIKTVRLDTRPLLQQVILTTNADAPVAVENNIEHFNLEIKADIKATPKNPLNPSDLNLTVSKVGLISKDVIEKPMQQPSGITLSGNVFKKTLPLKVGINEFSIEYVLHGKKINKNIEIERKGLFGNLYIVSIGIEYPEDGNGFITALKRTTHDAKAVRDSILATQKNVYKNIYHLLLNKKENTTANEIVYELGEFIARSKKNNITEKDVFLFFLSSHGQVRKDTPDTSWYIPASNFTGNYDKGAVNYNNDILPHLKQLSCKKILLLDACHSGKAISIKGSTEREEDIALQQRIAKHPAGYIIITSSKGEQNSIELKEHGAFTLALLEAISGKADHYSDENYRGNSDGIISFKELFNYISMRVKELAKEQQLLQEPTYRLDEPLERLKDFDLFKVARKR